MDIYPTVCELIGIPVPNHVAGVSQKPHLQNPEILGNIQWDDMEKNPYIPAFKKFKEYYDKGYLPDKWYARNWENDFEASFITKKSIFAIRGPWLWAKTLAADPAAKLSGVPLPAGKGGKMNYVPINVASGSVIYSQHVGTPIFEEVKKAYNWYMSPEVAEMRAQYQGTTPNLKKLSDKFTLSHPKFVKMVKPTLEGKYGNVQWINEPFGFDIAERYKVAGKPDVLRDKAIQGELGKYFEDEITLEDLMKYFKQRWETAYKFN